MRMCTQRQARRRSNSPSCQQARRRRAAVAVARRRPASPRSRLPEAARRVTCICAFHPSLCKLSSDVSCKAGFAAGGPHWQQQQQQQRRPPSGTKQATPPSSLTLLLSIPPPCPSAEHWSTFPAPFLRSAARCEVCQLLPPLRPPRQRCRHQTFWCLLEAGCLPASLGSIGILPLRQHPPAASALQNRPAGDQNSLVEFRPPAP